jgi:hypothetical protein
MLLGGASWTMFMSLFNIMVQKLAPDWVRARVLAVYLFVFQGSVAAGSALWGFVALHTNVHVALTYASIGTGACLLLGPWFRLPNTSADLSGWNHWVKPTMLEEPDPDEGPVLVTVKYSSIRRKRRSSCIKSTNINEFAAVTAPRAGEFFSIRKLRMSIWRAFRLTPGPNTSDSMTASRWPIARWRIECSVMPANQSR